MKKPKKVLILGSGAIEIGQAGEFDYSGSQAIKALKQEKIKTILINPNIATIQTSEFLADKIYFIPIISYMVEKIIKKERPDGIMLSFGGQTALDCGLKLKKKGILKKYNVRVLGTSVDAIEITEDRKKFVKKLKESNLKTPKSRAVFSVKQGIDAAKTIGYPVMARAAYSLGGLGSGVCYSEKELKEKLQRIFSKVNQVLIEEYLEGWKEIEYEVVRDCYDNCITVCNMENFDPMGIHTGESIVVAPSQTLTNRDYHKLREISIKTIRSIGVIGECNIQFAYNSKSEDYRIIEVNARLSRSSALASKATGYPLAFVAAKLGLGYPLTELKNPITLKTKACFEPALDYIVVKIPRWDLQKFDNVRQEIDTEMKSVGEVMAIGRKFEEALQKALRMLGKGMNGITCNKLSFDDLKKEIKKPTDQRIFAIAEAIKRGYSANEISYLSKIDNWFIFKIKNIIEIEEKIKNSRINKELLLYAKQHGFSDKQIGILINKSEIKVRELRKRFNIRPCIKQIDTLAAEYPAKTNYLYLTYNGIEDDIEFKTKNQVMVLGSGAYSIGSSVEFDWCCVNTVIALRKLGYKTIMVNYNPETVSTDHDICDKLVFDEISFETVMDIYEKEKPYGIIISMGGQISNSLALRLHKAGAKVLGTSPESIDNAENRHKFSFMLDELDIDQPEWTESTTIEQAERFAEKVGYPVLIRPSYVLSGAAMSVAPKRVSLEEYIKKASKVSKDYPIVISKFITSAKEIEIDAIANKGKLICWAISEHVENAGIHSGDATIVLPAQRIYWETARKIKRIAKQIAAKLKITGPFNIQFIAKNNDVKVIECNLRTSRSFPFVSKVFKTNFVDIATKAIMGKKTPKIEKSVFELDYVGVKAPQFSFARLKGSDPVLSVEMASTGEVACFGDDVYEAFLKSFISVGYRIPKKNILLSTGTPENKADLLHSCEILKKMGYKLYATRGTYNYLKSNNIDCVMLNWPLEKSKPNCIDYIKNKKIDMVVNIPKSVERKELSNDYIIRRTATDYSIPLITNAQVAKLFIRAISKYREKDLTVKSWDEY
jgi:carbamoyl-phosphate synthase large subunit